MSPIVPVVTAATAGCRQGVLEHVVRDPAMHPAALPPDVLRSQCEETRTRRRGPGGQHRNTTETAVVLVHRPTGITAEAAERRSQAENRSMAYRRLRLALAIEHRQPPADRPSPAWTTRVRQGRLVIAAAHDDYPGLVAEALDQLAAAGWKPAEAAARLEVTGSQLLRLLRMRAPVWTCVNRERGAIGLRPLA